jgi:hypothetical protein
MLDLQKYSCLGAALRDSLERFAGETCLIEADRDREKTRLTYSDFKEISACRWRGRSRMRISMPAIARRSS